MAITIGYPIQNDHEVDLMWESESARLWEELNAPDPCEKQLKDAALDMRLAIEQIDKAISYLMDAQGELDETPMAYRVGSLNETLEELGCDIRILAEKYGRGDRN